MSFSFGSKKTKQTAESDPWDVAIPDITDLLERLKLSGTGLGQLTGDQQGAIADLKTQASAGNPWEVDISNLTDKAFGIESPAPTVSQAYGRLEGQLGDYASGKYLDPTSNPHMQALLQMVADDASNRIKSTYAGAGRDIAGSAGGTQALARGVTEAQLPVLADQFAKNQAQQIDASKALYGAGVTTGQTVQSLNAAALATNMQGVGLSKEALAAKGYAPQQILAIEELAKTLPVEELGMLAELLFGAGQLGSQSKGTSKTTGSGFGIGLSDIGKVFSGFGSLGLGTGGFDASGN